MPTDDLMPAFRDPSAAVGPRSRPAAVRLWLDAGALAVAATAGAIAGLGLRRDGALEPFVAAGRLLLDVAPTELGAPRQMALAAGVLAHIGSVMAWSILFDRLAGRVRGVRLALFALSFAAVAALVDRRILPVSLRLGHGARGGATQTFFLYAVLSFALMVGMRLALIASQTGTRSRTLNADIAVEV